MSAKNLRVSRLILRSSFMLGLVLAALTPAAALERGAYSMEILVDGAPLRELAARGTTYIEALEGREYSVRLSNRTGRRIAVALAVDGLNSIDAKTTSARNASKWILGPHETITIDGWQTSSGTARRFYFTTEERSYGAWLGQSDNLGVISAAVFRERVARPAPIHRPRPKRSRRDSSPAGVPQELESRGKRHAESERIAPDAPQSSSELSDDLAATGIGREVDHRVRRVRFEAEPSPAAVMQLRYEYRDALVRLGVLPYRYAHREDPLGRRERARGFEDTGYAPDPFRR